MSRSGGERPPARRRPAGATVALLLAAALAAPAAAATPPRSLGGVDLNPAAEQALLQLQEEWLRWIGAFYQNSPERAGRVIEELLGSADQLGMSRLPDLSLGALARAVEVARDGDFKRARWALAAAERLDPGRPETAFATATVDRLEHRWAAAVASSARGWWRLARLPAERRLWLHDLALFALYVLVASGLLFIALAMVVRGPALFRDLVRAFAPALSRPVALLVAVFLLAWPLALPHAVVWTALYWSVLLWSYGATSERVVIAALWLLLGLMPFALAEQRLRIEVALSPAVRAMDSMLAERLYGGLFSDLGALRAQLPDDPAVFQLLADLQRRLGDPEAARALYHKVQELEPDNSDVLLDLGAYYFTKRDYGNAVRYFHDAASRSGSAAAYFDLSQAYSESYHFTESRQALDQAQRIDPARVGAWVTASATRRIQTFDRGFARAPEIRRSLLKARREATGGWSRQALARRGQTLLGAFVLALAALAVTRARRLLVGTTAAGAVTGSGPGRWWRALVPGLFSLGVGEGGRAFAAIALPMTCLLLPLGRSLGYRLPLGYDPGGAALWALGACGLVAFYAARLWNELREPV